MAIQIDSNLAFSTTATTWQEVCSITISGAGDYLILAGATFWWGTNGAQVEVRAMHQTTEISYALGSVGEGTEKIHGHTFNLAAIRTCADGDVIKIEAQTSNGWDTLYVDDIYLCIMPKPSNAQVDSDLTGGSYNTDTNWHDVATVNITPSGTQDILIMGQISYSASGTGVAVEVRLYDDTGSKEIKLGTEELDGADQYISAGWAFKIANVSAQRTVKVQVRTSNVSTSVQWKDAFVLAFPTDDVADFNDAYSASGSEEGTSPVEMVSKTWTPDTNTIYIILFYASIWTDDPGQWYYGVGWRTRRDGTTLCEEAYLGADDSPVHTQINIYGGTLAISSRTDDIYYFANSVNKTAFYEDACVMAWRESVGGGVTITPGVINLASAAQAETIKFGTTISPSAINLASSAQAETLKMGAGVAPAALNLVASLQDETVKYGSTLSPGAVVLPITPQGLTVKFGVTISPSAIDLPVQTQDETVVIGTGVVVSPNVIALTGVVPAETVKYGATVTPSAQTVLAQLQAESVKCGVTVIPAAINLVAATQDETVILPGQVVITPNAILIVSQTPLPTISAVTVKFKIPSAPRKTKFPAIASPKLHLVKSAQAMKEIHEVREGLRGDPLDRFVSVRDMLTDDAILKRLDARYYTETEIAVAFAAAAHHDEHDPEDGADALDCAAPSELAGVQASGEGNAHEFARANHAHQIQASIADNHIVTIDHVTPVATDYARFTGNGLEGREPSEVRGDINVEDGATADQTGAEIVALLEALVGLAKLSHDTGLSDISVDDHHAQAHTLESHSTKAHTELTGVTSDQHHAQNHKARHEVGGADLVNHDSLTGFLAAEHKSLPNTIAQVLSDHTKAVHDALGLSHDSLADVSIDDHHAQLHAASHNSGGGDELNHDSLAGFVLAEHLSLPNTIANVLSNHTKAVHDALGLSHDSLSDVSINDHHVHSPLSIPPVAFVPEIDTYDWSISQWYVMNRTALTSQKFHAPAIFPDGVTVSKLTLYGYRSDANAIMSLKLSRIDRATNVVNLAEVIADWTTGYSSGYDDTIDYATIDNANYTYALLLTLDPNTSTMDVRFTGATVEFA